MKVRDIMTEPPLTCTPETSVAARLMREADYGTLPVLDSEGRLVGVVTDRDICLAMAGTNRNALNVAVREAMTRKVISGTARRRRPQRARDDEGGSSPAPAGA